LVANGKQLSQATISNPTLTIDFNNRIFATALSVNAGQYGVRNLSAAGAVGANGLFVSSGGNMQVYGVLAPGSREAGYLFTQELGNTATIQGVTHWIH
jgi:hypothetical protein